MEQRSRARRVLGGGAVAAAAFVLLAGPASAHIEPDVSAVAANQPATVGFNLEHGCGDEATTKIAVQVPAEITDAQPVALDGWTTSVSDRVITFEGGPQPAHEELTYSITFTAPDQEGTVLAFPTIQTCGTTELAWLDPSEDDDHPAPTVKVVPADEAATAAAPEDDDHGHDEEATATTTASGEDASATEAAAAPADEEDSSSTAPLIIGGVILVLVVGTAIIIVVTRKRAGGAS